jgi:hypothetical protein
MSRVSIASILIGGVVDVAASIFCGSFLVLIVSLTLQAAHTSTRSSTALPVALLLNGLACSVLGGFVAARLARHDELLNAGLSFCLCVAIGLWLLVAGRESQPLWDQILLLAAGPACAVLGGYIRLRRKRARLKTA